MSFADTFLAEAATICARIDRPAVEKMVQILADCRAAEGRVFVLGVGGSAASASHLVNDLRKIARVETYAPTDNVAELTARTNDEGWATCFAGWLQGSHLKPRDVIFVLSVGGGDSDRNISPNLVQAIDYAKSIGARVVGIVGRDGGYTAKKADACVLIPVVSTDRITPHTESFHSVVGHLLVSHPALQAAATKWESAVSK
ncbi:MAG TPA: SIS domain-containing protein [Kiritimatiellia bacterium]|nr:SIS domain-containing protein [Kiritimatiellia bacterium]